MQHLKCEKPCLLTSIHISHHLFCIALVSLSTPGLYLYLYLYLDLDLDFVL